MDLFTAGGDDDDFPHHVAPFPDTSDLLYTPSTALIRSSELITHHQPPPPQKLRPIRCNGRSSPVVGELLENGGFVERCQNLTSPDVSYLNGEFCVVNGEPSQNLDDLGKQAHASETLREEDCRHISGSGGLEVQDPIGAGSGDVTNVWHPNAEGCLLEQESGSSSEEDEDEDNSSGSTKESGKRTKKTTRKLESFLENLVMKVMEKQEHMHKQLVDMIEKKEKERIIREEAWKQKEMERIKRDEEARAQEKSRNLALISFIQNLLGNEIQVPPPEASFLREEDEGGANIQNQKDSKSDMSNNRWPDAEVQALITLRTSFEHKFRLMGSKGSIWEEISEAMKNMGYNRSAKKCKEKWENINKYYKRTMGSGKRRRLNSKACPYFDELDILYENGLLNPGNVASDSDIVPKIEKE